MRLLSKSQLDEWAFVRVELGLSTAEYFDLTPVEYASLLEAWHKRQKHRAGEIASLYAMMANLLLHPKPPLTAADFLPKEPMTADEIMAGFRAAFPQQAKKTE